MWFRRDAETDRPAASAPHPHAAGGQTAALGWLRHARSLRLRGCFEFRSFGPWDLFRVSNCVLGICPPVDWQPVAADIKQPEEKAGWADSARCAGGP